MRKLSWRFKSRKIMSCVLLFLLLGTLQAMAQQKITGVVKDVSGETIAGANVMVKGTTTGTMTDLDGQFTLDASPNAVLQVSFIGYVSEDVKLGGKTSVIVILSEDTQALDEVVVEAAEPDQLRIQDHGRSCERQGNHNAGRSFSGTVGGCPFFCFRRWCSGGRTGDPYPWYEYDQRG